MADESAVTFHKGTGAVVHTGDAVKLYQAKVLRQSIKACQIGMRLNRSATPTNVMATISKFTGNRYTRGKAGMQKALDDINQWIAACEAAMPVEVKP